MNSTVNAFNGYPISVVFAVLLHGLVLGALFLFQRASTEAVDVIRPPTVRATLVGENPQARNAEAEQQRQAQKVQEQRAAQRREEERKQTAAREEERRVQEQQRQETARRSEQQRVAQLERQEQERKQTEQQKQAQEQKQREDQQRKEQEQRRQQEVAAQKAEQDRQSQEQAQQAQRDAEAQQRAAMEGEAVMSYTALIHDLVQRQWSRPPSARNGMVVQLRIRMVPTGEVVDVEIVRSSGDFAFDRAAETAVRRVGVIRELQGMEGRLFDRNFRTFLLTFRPEDLLN